MGLGLLFVIRLGPFPTAVHILMQWKQLLIVMNNIDSLGSSIEALGCEGWKIGNDFDLELKLIYLLKP